MDRRLTSALRSAAAYRHTPAILFGLAALVLRLWNLESRSLWNDEMFTLQLARLPLGDIPSALTAQYRHPPLYFLIAHFCTALFGPTAWAIRFPSALFGALTVGLLYHSGARLFRREAGAIAAALLLVAPFHIAYSQEGRPYALAGLLCLVSFTALLRMRGQTTPLRSAVFAASTIALLYTHHWGLFAVAAEVLTVALLSTEVRNDLRNYAAPFLAIALCYLPEIFSLRLQATTHDPGGWFWVEPAGADTLGMLVLAFSGSYFKFAEGIFDAGEVVRWSTALLSVWTAALLGVAYFRGRPPGLRPLLLMTALFLLLPIVGSVFKPELFVWYRFPVIALPPLVLAVGAALSVNRVSLALAGALVAFQIAGAVEYQRFEKGNARAVAAYVDSVAADSNVLIIRPKAFAPLLEYYLKSGGRRLDEAYLNGPLGDIVDTARAFVYVSLDVPNQIRDYMNGHFVKQEERRFPAEAHMGIVVGLYRQPPDPDEP